MNYQKFVIEITEKAAGDLFKSAKAMPEDKLVWRPLEVGRSALDYAGESAQMAEAALYMIGGEKKKTVDPSQFTEMVKERGEWKTIEECEKAFHEKFKTSKKIIESTPDSELEQMVDFPFGQPGEQVSIAEVMLSTYWQLVYHLGQINYIQTLYGDMEMH